jgi:hypothetical protein
MIIIPIFPTRSIFLDYANDLRWVHIGEKRPIFIQPLRVRSTYLISRSVILQDKMIRPLEKIIFVCISVKPQKALYRCLVEIHIACKHVRYSACVTRQNFIIYFQYTIVMLYKKNVRVIFISLKEKKK